LDVVVLALVSGTKETAASDFGSFQFAAEGDTVEMKSGIGTSTSSVDLDYQWEQTEGPPVTLGVRKDGSAKFVAPPVTKDREQLAFRLTVRVEGDDDNVYEDSFAVDIYPTAVTN